MILDGIERPGGERLLFFYGDAIDVYLEWVFGGMN